MKDGLDIAIKKLEREIASLPKGYITYKTVSGNRYPYHQWQEEGHKSSVFLHEDEVPYIAEEIDHRKVLEEKLKEMKKTQKFRQKNPDAFRTSVIFGSGLDLLVNVSGMFPRKRINYDLLWSYLHDDTILDVLILYGLRNTGKTIMISQVIAAMSDEERANTAFINVNEENVIDDLIHDLNILRDQDYRFIFIDEVTKMEDFINNSAVLTNIYAWGMKIVLSGTDSLSLNFAYKDDMFERSIMLHTNYMSFSEWSYISGSNDVDEYLKNAGMLATTSTVIKGREELSVANGNYMYRAIALNIQNSVVNYKGIGNLMYLETLRAKDELVNAIQRIVEDMNHAFLVDVINRNFRSSDLSLTMRNLAHSSEPERRISLREIIDIEAVTETLMHMLDIKDIDDREIPISNAVVAEIERYLGYLEVFEYGEVRDINHPFEKPINTVLLTQPRLRYVQVMALIDALQFDKGFAGMTKEKRSIVRHALETEVLGRMLEEAVMLATRKNIGSSRFHVFKLVGDSMEIDMVIHDSAMDEVYLFEIKHSIQRVDNQKRHLVNPSFMDEIEKQYGEIKGRYIIYRGDAFADEDGIRYLNAGNFLQDIENIELPSNGIVYSFDD